METHKLADYQLKFNRKTKFSIKENLDFIFPITLWLIIFGKNVFSSLLFVDYVPSTFFNIQKWLVLSNYSSIFSVFDVLKLVFSYLGLLSVLFQLSILISMLFSYFYIKRLFREKSRLFSILFSLIFFFNPFVYSRIMIGQIGVLTAYILMPVYIFYLFLFFKKINTKSLIKLTLSIVLISLFSIHFIVINIIIFAVASIFIYLYQNPEKKIGKYFIYSAIFIVLIILLNSFWIQGIFSSKILSSIDSSDEQFFSPKMSTDIPAVAKIMGMSGFWREAGYTSTYNLIDPGLWYLLLAFLLICFLTGFYINNDKKSKFFYSLFWTGLILGTGISHPYIRPFFDFLFTYIPFFNGFRDSHKFVSLIALAYSYFIPIFILEIVSKMKRAKVIPVLVLVAFVLFFNFPLIILHNQVQPVSYPDSYYEVNDFIDYQGIGKIIYLPWQTYLTYSWTIGSSSDGRISVPINQIVKKPVITGADRWGSKSDLIDGIASCINNKNVSCLEEHSVQLVLKDKCAYYPDKYEWINQTNAEQVLETDCIDIYELNNKIVEPEQAPLRFILGSAISLLTFIVLIAFLIILNVKYRKFT